MASAQELTRRATRRWNAGQPQVALGLRPAGTVAAAVDAGLFQEADILLLHHFRHPVAWVIRVLSGSYWNHAALVGRSPSDAADAQLEVVEAHWRGTRRWPLREFLEAHSRSVMAVRRVPTDVLDRPARHRIARLAAEAVGSPYDFSLLLRMARLAARDLVRRYRSGRPALPALLRLTANLAESARGFICSGLVQWSYWMGVEPEQRPRVLFVPGLEGPLPEALPRVATPDHLARSANLEWAYLITDGQAWALAPADQGGATSLAQEDEAQRVA